MILILVGFLKGSLLLDSIPCAIRNNTIYDQVRDLWFLLMIILDYTYIPYNTEDISGIYITIRSCLCGIGFYIIAQVLLFF
ncbi:hypothetical protein DHC50_19200 [Arenibacter sp. A80]|nr:hypothetical protein [Arenibacter sp. A80]RFT54583.1 hypothetical protein D0S24_19195 [Arenibacter sp. P308M17]